jgi:hypothetical protein
MKNVIDRYRRHNKLLPKALRDMLICDIDDFDFYRKQMNDLRHDRKMLYPFLGRGFIESQISIAEYYANGNFFVYVLRRIGNLFLLFTERCMHFNN